MKNLPTNLSNLKRIIDKLDVDKLLSVRVNLIKSSDVVKNDVVEKIFMMLRKKNIEDKIPDIINWATKTSLNGRTKLVKYLVLLT